MPSCCMSIFADSLIALSGGIVPSVHTSRGSSLSFIVSARRGHNIKTDARLTGLKDRIGDFPDGQSPLFGG